MYLSTYVCFISFLYFFFFYLCHVSIMPWLGVLAWTSNHSNPSLLLSLSLYIVETPDFGSTDIQ